MINNIQSEESINDFLKSKYLKLTNEELSNKLNLSKSSVRRRLNRLGLKRTQEQINFLKNNSESNKKIDNFIILNFEKLPYEKIAKKVDLSISGLQKRVSRLGLKRVKKQIEIICVGCGDKFFVIPSEKSRKYCSKRCYNIISGKQTIGHKWTEKEEKFLGENYIEKTNNELARILQVTPSGIEHKLKRLGLKRPYEQVKDRLIKARVRGVKKKKVVIKCIECGKDLPPLLPCFAKLRRFCSKSCGSKFMNKNNETLKEHKQGFGKRMAKYSKRIKKMVEAQENGSWLANRSGKKSHFWIHGKACEPYSTEFNKQLKRHVRELWKNRCFWCHTQEDLCIHHIDYNKKNSSVKNLICLCRPCHSKTNKKREYWRTFFQAVIGNP